MRLRHLIPAAAVVTLLLVGTAPASASTPPVDDAAVETTEIRFPSNTGANLRNPERGLFDAIEPFELATKESFGSAKKNGYSLVHGAADLSSFTSGEISKEWLDSLRSAFTALRESGLKVILRFTYSPKVAKTVKAICPDPYTDPLPESDIPPDASLETISHQLTQLSPILAENADVIAALDAGFIGTWGEWHCSTNHLATAEGKAAVLDAVLAAFPANRQVALRYPADIIDLVDDPASASSRVGSHQDCYAASVPDDAGTWDPPFAPEPGKDYSVESEKAMISTLGERHIVGGEACQASPRTTCDIANQELPYMHFSYLSGEFDAGAIAAYGPECWADFGRRLGYRLQLDSARIPLSAHPGTTLPLSFTLTNTGFAAMYNPRPVFVIVEGNGYRHAEQLQVDPRDWAPGNQVTVTSQIHLPKDLRRGEYRVSVWMPDESEGLRSNHDYSVQFANDGVWDQSQGVNVLASIRVEATLPATGVPVRMITLAATGGLAAILLGLAASAFGRRRYEQ